MIRALVSNSALQHNLAFVRAKCPESRVTCVIKANAYGHGLTNVARALVGCDSFGVARLEEAIALRDAGTSVPITLLEGVRSSEQLLEAVHQQCDIVVHEPSQLTALLGLDVDWPRMIWIKVDTGLNRLGFRADEAISAFAALQALVRNRCNLGLMTHFACADDPGNPMTSRQLEQIREVANKCRSSGASIPLSVANSAGLLGWPDSRVAWVRAGLALYGISPFRDQLGTDLGLRAAMRLESSIMAIRAVQVGESVGYGASWVAPRTARIAIVAAGYGDGVSRSLSNNGHVLIEKCRAPIVGRVSMDMLAADVTGVPAAGVGSQVLLWGGPDLPVEQVASWAGTIPYELVCGVSQRVPTVVVE